MLQSSRKETLILMLGLGVAILSLPSLPAFAQIDTGAIVGTVRDTSGAVVPNAAVKVTNMATGITIQVTTNKSGEYLATPLIPGTYRVEVSSAGFQSEVTDNVVIHVQSRPSVDFTLKVGSVATTVQVESAAPLLQTQTADVGGVVNSQQLVTLPLNGRYYADLALLQAGVQRYFDAANPATDLFSANGNLQLQNDFTLDGVWNNSGSENLQEGTVQMVQPPPDALQEFRVQTRTYSAEFGTSAGAVVNASIKSGTNQFHGDAWEFLRNNVFDANTFFNNADGVPISHFSQNQYGGTIGGPIKKDKAFFFFDFQNLNSSTATTTFSIVPTPLMKQGDFTELGFPIQSVVPGQAGCVTNNVISPSCLDPTGMKLASLFPNPNIPSAIANLGQPGSWTGGNNYEYQTNVPDDTYSLDGRVDYTVNARNTLFGRYSDWHENYQSPLWTSNPIAGNGDFATQFLNHGQAAALGWTDTISNDMVNEARFGFDRMDANSDPIGLTLGQSDATNYGLLGVPQTPFTAGIPPININGLTRLGSSPWRPQIQISQAWDLVDNLSWLKGTHSFKFGYEMLHTSNNFLDIQAPQGEINPSGIFTNNGSFGLPDFLLGDISGVQDTTALVVHNYQIGNSFYAQDTWRTTPKLTLNYGLRYELFSPVLNHQNQTSNFSPANGGEIISTPANASGWKARSLVNPNYNNFAPRFGFAYHPLEKVVLRGGFGIFYDHFYRIGSESMMQLNYPYLLDLNLSQNLGSTQPLFFLRNGFPDQLFTPAGFSLPNDQIRAQDPNQPTQYVDQLSFGPEFELSNTTVLDLTYVGNYARHMQRLRNYNQGIVTGFDSSGDPIVSFPYPNLNTIQSGVFGPGQHAFLEMATNDGNMDYNALEVSLRRNADARHLNFGVNYTWSHGLADFVDNLTGGALPQNAYDYAAEMSNSILDVEQRFVANATYQLPIGQGGKILNGNGLGSRLMGGWVATSIFTIQSGFPFNINAPDMSFTGPAHNSYANCTGAAFTGAATSAVGPGGYVGAGTGFFINPAAFAIPSAGEFGNCAPRTFHGPGFADWDLGVLKNFNITETKYFEFRSEFFNTLNHPNFDNPFADIAFPGSFGKVFNTVGIPRQIQFALKFYF
jgi:hypothetical protein